MVLVGLFDELNNSGFDLRSLAAQVLSEEQALRVGKWLAIAGVLMLVFKMMNKGTAGRLRDETGDTHYVDDPGGEGE